jgi:hypothetical protein
MRFIGVLMFVAAYEVVAQDVPYRLGIWDADSLGNHRVILRVESKQVCDAVRAHIPWRRRDLHPDQKNLILVDATTGKQITNLLRIDVNREYGDVVFQPGTMPGTYQLYILPFVGTKKSNYPKLAYPKPEQSAEEDWLWRNYLTEADLKLQSWRVLPKAQVIAFEARDSLDAYWPMEVIATRAEMDSLASAHPGAALLVFPEVRENSIKMTDDLPFRWILRGPGGAVRGVSLRGEFFVFQLGVFAMRHGLQDLRLRFTDLRTSPVARTISASRFTCLNLGGVDNADREFSSVVSVDSGKVRPLWCGVKIDEGVPAGRYTGSLTLGAGEDETTLPVEITVLDSVASDCGDDEPQNLSRLRWLNSRLAVDDSVIAPYQPVQVRGNAMDILGRRITLGADGLPTAIESFFTEEMTAVGPRSRPILASPFQILVEDSTGTILPFQYSPLRMTKQAPGAAAWEVTGTSPGLTMHVRGTLEGDGTLEYAAVLSTDRPRSVSNVRLVFAMPADVAKFAMGLGLKGGVRPPQIDWVWDVTRNQDGAWLGDVNAGLQFTLKDENYTRPLNTNFYKLKPLAMPTSWCNGGKGGIRIGNVDSETVSVVAFSGSQALVPGQQLAYNFRLMVTPFHPLNTREQFATRYYHRFDDLHAIAATGANTVNVHHATPINPYLNYPFLQPAAMKAYADSAHALGMKMKIYYTVRELTNRAPELFALRSLGEEIFVHGSGGGASWLQEHLGGDYIAGWYVPELKDAAIITSGVSRWHNFYVEGVAWLLRNIGIDGLYIDDVAFDRLTMKRIRKLLDRLRPGSLIDLHSANQYNERDGFANSANLYLEHFPYLDRLWFGEYFDYAAPPDYWMVEVSGIPFGLMGEMLEKGGNPWRGMLYGMTSRLPWAGDPRSVWKLWDAFGIQDSRMIGYWVTSNPVKTDDPDVLATVFLKKGRAMVALASWAAEPRRVRLSWDWKGLGLNSRRALIVAPEVEAFQSAAHFTPDQELPVEPGKGMVLIVE